MIRRPLRPLPLWYVALVALAAWVIVRVLPHAGPPDALPIAYAWFAWLIFVAQAIWTGVEFVGHLTLVALGYAVQAIWTTLTLLHNAALELGRAAIAGFKSSWTFLKAAYEDVLKPGWDKFWLWIDRAKKWLQDFFAPVFSVLRRIRDEILGFYDHWVRPVLDAIGIARKILSVLTTLGLSWAKALDAKLARLQEQIDAPFRFALAKINEVIGIVDRIVTVNGLFQRLALVRSIERDIKYIHAALHNARYDPIDDVERKRLTDKNQPPPKQQLFDDFDRFLQNHTGPLVDYDALVDLDGTIFSSRWSSRGAA